MKKLMLVVVLFCSGCSSLGFVNEDAGLSMMGGDVSVPANGSVRYTIERMPNMSPEARAWARENKVSRSVLSWFGFGGGPQVKNAGSGRQKTPYNGSGS